MGCLQRFDPGFVDSRLHFSSNGVESLKKLQRGLYARDQRWSSGTTVHGSS